MVPGPGVGRRVTGNRQGEYFELKEPFCVMIGVVATQLDLSKFIEVYSKIGESCYM